MDDKQYVDLSCDTALHLSPTNYTTQCHGSFVILSDGCFSG